MDLKVGDIVKLKTGGPKMTVNRVGPFGEDPSNDAYLGTDEVETVWFYEREQTATLTSVARMAWEYVSTHRFGAAALEKAE